MTTGRVFNIERYAVHDGHGIRTLVFLKGCPLRCLWCANPEGQKLLPQLLYTKHRCIGCRACVEACSEGTLTWGSGGLEIRRERCSTCGACVRGCYAEALQLDSHLMSVDEVMKEVRKDLKFYRRSGGGVTLSGGEPLIQRDFAVEILKACRGEFIDTAIETCGHYPPEHLAQALPLLKQVFFDVKHILPGAHEHLTGMDNRLVLDNLRGLAEWDGQVVVRVPIIPGYNDDRENIDGIAKLVRELSNQWAMELLPYHNLGTAKYHKLDMEYELGDINPPSASAMETLRDRVRTLGVRCLAG